MFVYFICLYLFIMFLANKQEKKTRKYFIVKYLLTNCLARSNQCISVKVNLSENLYKTYIVIYN